MKYGTAGQVDGPISRRRSMERLAPDQLGVGLTGAPTDSPHTAAPGAIAIAPWANRWCMCGCLPRDLAAPANVATTEPKFAVSRQVGEWWCTVTSPAFFLGTLIYAQFPMERIEPEVHVLVWGAVGKFVCESTHTIDRSCVPSVLTQQRADTTARGCLGQVKESSLRCITPREYNSGSLSATTAQPLLQPLCTVQY